MRYISYYGMEKNPFVKEENAKEVYESRSYKEGYARLEYIKEIKGIGLITGMPGVGKTTLLRSFKEKINKEKYNVVYIPITNKGKFEFINMICKELGIDLGDCYINNIKKKIQETIKREKEEYGKETIIIIDNAEKLTKEMILDMNYLYEFECDSIDYTSIILCGGEEIREELTKNIYESLKQRIICMYKMSGLTKEEVEEYIKTRIEQSNQTNEIFTKPAINALKSMSHGIIRKLNTLINLSLMIGYSEEKQQIDEEIIRMAVEENKL